MISKSDLNVLPSEYLWYRIVKLFLRLFFYALFFSILGNDFLGIFLGFSIWFGLPFSIWYCLYYKSISFSIQDDGMTINSGVLSKRSKTLLFNSIQSIDAESSLFQQIFNLSEIKIWTASPSQSQSGNERHEADGILFLISDDARQLKELVHA